MKTEHIIKGKVAFLSQGIWRKGGGRSWGKERGKERRECSTFHRLSLLFQGLQA